MALVGKR